MDNRQLRKLIEEEFKTVRLLRAMEGLSTDPKPNRTAYLQRIDAAIACLPAEERELIEQRYMGPECDYVHDYQVYEAMGISPTKYRYLREKALSILATYLNLNLAGCCPYCKRPLHEGGEL